MSLVFYHIWYIKAKRQQVLLYQTGPMSTRGLKLKGHPNLGFKGHDVEDNLMEIRGFYRFKGIIAERNILTVFI